MILMHTATGCIDKTSSSELSDAINSMFRWYGGASKCYAYLSDPGLRIRLPLIRKNQKHYAGILNCHQGGRRITLSLENTSQVLDHKSTTADTYALLEEDALKCDELQWTKTINKSSIVIARQPPPKLRQLASGERRRLWLRLADDDRTSKLTIEDCFPVHCWEAYADEIDHLKERIARFGKFETREQPFVGGLVISYGSGQHHLRLTFQLQADAKVYGEDGTIDISSLVRFRMIIRPETLPLGPMVPVPYDSEYVQRLRWVLLDRERSIRRKERLEGFGSVTFDVRAEQVLGYWDYVLRISVDSVVEEGD